VSAHLRAECPTARWCCTTEGRETVTLLCRSTVFAAALLTCLAEAPSARAQSVADFYRGKTLNVLVGVGAGGEYDLLARTLAKHIGRHIPGNPLVVTQNMTGASGLKMANFMFTQAPQDGTTIGVIQNTLVAAQAAGLSGIQFDGAKFRWLGTIAPVVETMAVWHTTGVKTIEDARKKEVIVGGTARGAITYGFPALMNELIGTKFKIVTGYDGGNPINLAMERGEVEARNNTWSSWKTTKAAWLKDKKIAVIAQAGPRAPDLDAPSLEDMARTPEERQIIELVVSGTQFGRPFAITPGTPEDRVKALRAAFDAVMEDPAFLADAASLNFDVTPVNGEALDKVAAKVVSTPKELAARARQFLE
jgi:tripartite-type tricarboxylate transporter receptor subunit TctC